MTDENETMALLLSMSTMLLVVGLLFLDGTVWYVQYAVLALSLGLSIFAATQSALFQGAS